MLGDFSRLLNTQVRTYVKKNVKHVVDYIIDGRLQAETKEERLTFISALALRLSKPILIWLKLHVCGAFIFRYLEDKPCNLALFSLELDRVKHKNHLDISYSFGSSNLECPSRNLLRKKNWKPIWIWHFYFKMQSVKNEHSDLYYVHGLWHKNQNVWTSTVFPKFFFFLFLIQWFFLCLILGR